MNIYIAFQISISSSSIQPIVFNQTSNKIYITQPSQTLLKMQPKPVNRMRRNHGAKLAIANAASGAVILLPPTLPLSISKTDNETIRGAANNLDDAESESHGETKRVTLNSIYSPIGWIPWKTRRHFFYPFLFYLTVLRLQQSSRYLWRPSTWSCEFPENEFVQCSIWSTV